MNANARLLFACLDHHERRRCRESLRALTATIAGDPVPSPFPANITLDQMRGRAR